MPFNGIATYFHIGNSNRAATKCNVTVHFVNNILYTNKHVLKLVITKHLKYVKCNCLTKVVTPI